MYFKVNHKQLGKRCQHLRKMAGWKQADIASEIGCDIRSISMFETGNTTSFRILSWYIMNGIVDSDMIRGCEINGENKGKSFNRSIS